MMTAMKISVTLGREPLPNINASRTKSPLKSSSSSSDSPDILSTAVLHKRRPQKRVRFALKLERLEGDSLPSSREVSASSSSKSTKRVIDPWRPDGPLYGTYVEYLEKQDVSPNNDLHIRRPSPPPPSPDAELPTYTHTFVIQSKSPELIIDSITVSTPSFHLPRIVHPTKKSNKQQSPALDSYVKQHITLSTTPRMIHTKKVTNPSNQQIHYASIHAALKRAELSLPPTTGLHANNKVTRPDIALDSKLAGDHNQQQKMTEIISRPLPGVNNQINHFSERSILPNYSRKARMHNRTPRLNDELDTNGPYFLQKHDTDHFLPPVIHSNH